MLALLTPTHAIECDRCRREAVRAAVDVPGEGFVVHLCPLHLGVFLQKWMDDPASASAGLTTKLQVAPE